MYTPKTCSYGPFGYMVRLKNDKVRAETCYVKNWITTSQRLGVGYPFYLFIFSESLLFRRPSFPFLVPFIRLPPFRLPLSLVTNVSLNPLQTHTHTQSTLFDIFLFYLSHTSIYSFVKSTAFLHHLPNTRTYCTSDFFFISHLRVWAVTSLLVAKHWVVF